MAEKIVKVAPSGRDGWHLLGAEGSPIHFSSRNAAIEYAKKFLQTNSFDRLIVLGAQGETLSEFTKAGLSAFSTAQKEEISRALEGVGATLPCGRCGNKQFSLLDGFFSHPVQSGPNLVLGGTTVPVVVTVCTRCGFISQHAAALLNLEFFPLRLRHESKENL
jgi:hypothetical protein